MPSVDVKILQDVWSSDQKRALIEGITGVFASVGGEGAGKRVTVMVTEVPEGQFAVGGVFSNAATARAGMP